MAELLNGKPGPLLNIEHRLWNTYAIATQRFREQEQGRGGKGKRR